MIEKLPPLVRNLARRVQDFDPFQRLIELGRMDPSRREFGRRGVGLVAISQTVPPDEFFMIAGNVLSSPRLASVDQPANADDEQKEPKKEFYDWDGVFRLVKKIQKINPQSEMNQPLESKVLEVKAFFDDEMQRANRLKELDEEAQEYEKTHPNTPSVRTSYKKILQGIDPKLIDVEEAMPHTEIKDSLFGLFIRTRSFLSMMQPNSPEFSDFWNGNTDLQIKNFIDSANQNLGNSDREKAPNGLEIEMADGIIPTVEGMVNYESDIEKIQKFVETFSYIKKIPFLIKLFSAKYASLKELVLESGSHSSKRTIGGERYSEVWVNMDIERSSAGEQAPVEAIFAHEAFGHGGSVLTNKSLARILTPEEHYERLRFELQILTNPDWGYIECNIPELFAHSDNLASDPKTIYGDPKISTAEFKDIIRTYPLRAILTNQYHYGGAELFSQKNPLFPEDFDFGPPGAQTLKDFLSHYGDWLKEKALTDKKAAAVLWGLQTFPHELEDNSMIDKMVPLTMKDKPARVWARYLDTIAYASLMHAVFNNEASVRTHFDHDEEWRDLGAHFFNVKMAGLQELWAHGTAFSHFFGDRMEVKEGIPYREGLKDLARRLTK